MGRVIRKILCPNPNHIEETPSCGVYADGTGYCFSCSSFFPKLAEPENTILKEKPSENLQERIAYIKSLPKTPLRGLCFPYDKTGYYILWPSSDYYKCRRWIDNGNGKYVSPSGHTKPIFHINSPTLSSNYLYIVEGEINALSLADCGIIADIMSPGGVGNFTDNQTRSYLQATKNYASVKIVVDNDAVGLDAAIKVKELLVGRMPDIEIKLMEQDCNTILETYGKEELKKEMGL